MSKEVTPEIVRIIMNHFTFELEDGDTGTIDIQTVADALEHDTIDWEYDIEDPDTYDMLDLFESLSETFEITEDGYDSYIIERH